MKGASFAWFVLLVCAACSEKPIGLPAGSNNFDDPDDPGQSGQNNGTADAATDASGRFCVAPRDCPATMVCAYPITDGCGAAGRCLPYTAQAGCDATFACGCDGKPVALCAPTGYAPKAVSSASPCDGGVGVNDAGAETGADAASADAASD